MRSPGGGNVVEMLRNQRWARAEKHRQQDWDWQGMRLEVRLTPEEEKLRFYLWNNSIIEWVVFKKDFISLFLERGRVGEREGEKHQCVLASVRPLLDTWPATQACAWTGN